MNIEKRPFESERPLVVDCPKSGSLFLAAGETRQTDAGQTRQRERTRFGDAVHADVVDAEDAVEVVVATIG